MDGLPAADRQVFLDAARDAALRGRAFIRDNEAKQLAELQAAGMEIEEHPDMDAFRKATEPVLAGLDAESKKIVKQIQQAVK